MLLIHCLWRRQGASLESCIKRYSGRKNSLKAGLMNHDFLDILYILMTFVRNA